MSEAQHDDTQQTRGDTEDDSSSIPPPDPMDVQPTTSPPWGLNGRTLGIAALVVLAAYGGIQIITSMRSGGSRQSVRTEIANTEIETARDVQHEARALARVELLASAQDADAAEAIIDTLAAETSAWQNEVEPLLDNDTGRLLARTSMFVERFREIYNDTSRAEQGTANRLRSILATLREPVQRALDSQASAYVPDPAFGERIQEIKQQAREAIESYRRPRREIDSMIAAARKNTEAGPGELTMAQAITAVLQRKSMERAEGIAAEHQAKKSLEAQRHVLARSHWLELSDLGERLTALIDDLEHELAAWDSNVTALLTNDSGKFLAADDLTIEAFQEIYTDTTRATSVAPQSLRRRLENVMNPVNSALADTQCTYAPSDDLKATLQEIDLSAQHAVTAWRKPRQDIEGLLSLARKRHTGATLQLTLAEAIDALHERQTRERAVTIAAAVQAERKRADDELAELEAEIVRKETDRRLARRKLEDDQRELAAQRDAKRMKGEEEERQREAERQAAERKAEEEHRAAQARLAEKLRKEKEAQELRDAQAQHRRELAQANLDAIRQRAADPAVQAKHQPFLGKGLYIFRPTGHPGINPIRNYDYAKPASLKRLKECGVLSSPAVFWKTGMAVDGFRADQHGYAGQGDGNDRPAWTLNPQTEEDWKLVQERYDEFTELAPYWVEMGVLQP